MSPSPEDSLDGRASPRRRQERSALSPRGPIMRSYANSGANKVFRASNDCFNVGSSGGDGFDEDGGGGAGAVSVSHASFFADRHRESVRTKRGEHYAKDTNDGDVKFRDRELQEEGEEGGGGRAAANAAGVDAMRASVTTANGQLQNNSGRSSKGQEGSNTSATKTPRASISLRSSLSRRGSEDHQSDSKERRNRWRLPPTSSGDFQSVSRETTGTKFDVDGFPIRDDPGGGRAVVTRLGQATTSANAPEKEENEQEDRSASVTNPRHRPMTYRELHDVAVKLQDTQWSGTEDDRGGRYEGGALFGLLDGPIATNPLTSSGEDAAAAVAGRSGNGGHGDHTHLGDDDARRSSTEPRRASAWIIPM